MITLEDFSHPPSLFIGFERKEAGVKDIGAYRSDNVYKSKFVPRLKARDCAWPKIWIYYPCLQHRFVSKKWPLSSAHYKCIKIPILYSLIESTQYLR